MFREIACAAAFLVTASLTACHTETDGSARPASSSATTTTTTQAAAPDQSETFFPSTVEFYGLDHTDTDRDHLRELYALRQIDPCGFVDEETLTAEGHGDFSYTYTPVHGIATDFGPPVTPIGGNGCTIAFPDAPVGLSLEVMPGEVTGIDSSFVPAESGVEKDETICRFRVALPLTESAGAPTSMRDPRIQVHLQHIAEDGSVSSEDGTATCPLAEKVATSIATQVREHGVPSFAADSSAATRFLTADPCAAATNLDATGVAWNEPNATAQFFTTWRHPEVCNLTLSSDSDKAEATVRYGLAAWNEDIVSSMAGDKPTVSERDGVQLTSFPRCFVLAKANETLTPVAVGSGAPELTAPTPIVAVAMTGTTKGDCVDAAQDVAVAAIKRAS